MDELENISAEQVDLPATKRRWAGKNIELESDNEEVKLCITGPEPHCFTTKASDSEVELLVSLLERLGAVEH